MKIHSFMLFGLISIAHGFLSPFMKMAPNLHQAVTNKQSNRKQSTLKPAASSRPTTFHGMPNPFWFAQTIDASRSRQQSVRPNERSQHFDGTNACSYPCQRVPYYLKFEHALIMNGLEREISSIMTSPAVNTKGFVDVDRCEGSCRKAEAQNIRVSWRTLRWRSMDSLITTLTNWILGSRYGVCSNNLRGPSNWIRFRQRTYKRPWNWWIHYQRLRLRTILIMWINCRNLRILQTSCNNYFIINVSQNTLLGCFNQVLILIEWSEAAICGLWNVNEKGINDTREIQKFKITNSPKDL